MNPNIIIALDQGSSSSRALAVDPQGRVLAVASVPVQTHRPQEGLAELDAASLWQGQMDALQKILTQVGEQSVAALAVTSQRSTVVFWDKKTGQPLAPALSWQDGRAGQISQTITLSQEKIHQLTGLYNTPFYSAAKITWALQHVAAVKQAAQEGRLCIGPVASYLIWKLTGGKVFACDATLAQRMLLLNIHTGQWDSELLAAFGIKPEWLPQLKASCDDYGSYEVNGHSLPICVCVGDQQASLAALQIHACESCINYGTGAFFMHHTAEKCCITPGLLTSVLATPAAGSPCQYVVEGPVNACGTIFAWLQALGFDFDAKEAAALYPQARQPIWLLPALGGLGAPYWDFTLSPVMAGFSPHTTKADVAAGAINSIALLLADIVFYAQQFGLKNSSVKVTGGLSQNQALLQVQADVLQCPLRPCSETEGTALGAAWLAAQYATEQKNAWPVNLLPQVTPKMAAADAKEWYGKWQQFVQWCKKK